MEKTRVLIVDDSPEVRNGLQSILTTHPDLEVVGEAQDGLEALTMAEQLRPDVILMDSQMPVMDGVEATRQMKERWPTIKILVLTVHTMYIESALAAGADDCLMKDVTSQELLYAVRRVAGLA